MHWGSVGMGALPGQIIPPAFPRGVSNIDPYQSVKEKPTGVNRRRNLDPPGGTIGPLLSCHRTTGGSHATCGTGPAPKRSGRFKSPADWPCEVPELSGRDAPHF